MLFSLFCLIYTILCHYAITSATQISDIPQCDCGYSDPATLSTWSEVWHMSFGDATGGNSGKMQQQLYSYKELFFSDYIISPKFNDAYPRVFRKENVRIQDNSLEVRVTVDTNQTNKTESIRCGGVGTNRQNFMYGSFRSFMRTTKVGGTVAGMFLYNAQGEIDIELLSSVKPLQAYFAMHPGLIEHGKASPLTHGNKELAFDPSDGYHEYRFDWFPNLAVFYVDGVESYRMTTNVLSLPSRVMFNHWTDGNANFSQGPAKQDASIHIKNMTFFFNTSDVNTKSNCLHTRKTCDIEKVVRFLHSSESSKNNSNSNSSSSADKDGIAGTDKSDEDLMFNPFERAKSDSSSALMISTVHVLYYTTMALLAMLCFNCI